MVEVVPTIHTDPDHRALTETLFRELASTDSPQTMQDEDPLTLYAVAARLAVAARRLGWTPPARRTDA